MSDAGIDMRSFFEMEGELHGNGLKHPMASAADRRNHATASQAQLPEALIIKLDPNIEYTDDRRKGKVRGFHIEQRKKFNRDAARFIWMMTDKYAWRVAEVGLAVVAFHGYPVAVYEIDDIDSELSEPDNGLYAFVFKEASSNTVNQFLSVWVEEFVPVRSPRIIGG